MPRELQPIGRCHVYMPTYRMPPRLYADQSAELYAGRKAWSGLVDGGGGRSSPPRNGEEDRVTGDLAHKRRPQPPPEPRPHPTLVSYDPTDHVQRARVHRVAGGRPRLQATLRGGRGGVR
eukprot:6549127-Pyramimonas_sp.AAC.1